jgi:predicted dehydrogenase
MLIENLSCKLRQTKSFINIKSKMIFNFGNQLYIQKTRRENMTKQISIVLIGIGGYGNSYLKKLIDEPQPVSITGVVDVNPKKCEYYDWIVDNNIPIFSSIEDFYTHSHADLAIISTPIHFHTSQTCYALSHGSNVLCEKPMCSTVQDAQKIVDTCNSTGKFAAIGFNWSFSPSVQQLKQDIINGVFGKAKRLKTLVLWPRNEDYYNRSAWAGKQYSENGDVILDSVANNATAHYLHHMFYLLGAEKEKSAKLHSVTAELYRANPIETFDSCAVKVKTEEDVDILFYTSHAVDDSTGPIFNFEFEEANITYTSGSEANHVVAQFHDGSEKVYSDPQNDHLIKLQKCIQATAEGNHDILCGPEAASAHVLCISGMHASVPEIIPFPEELIKQDEESKLTWVEGLNKTLIECYNDWRLPSEAGISWSRKGQTIDLTQLTSVRR